MKRHPLLQEFSREHHTALKLALDARRAVQSGDPAVLAEAVRICRQAAQDELDPHFQSEEDALLRYLPESDPTARRLRERLLHEHAELRRWASELHADAPEELAAFTELLGAHARFEERELFPFIERQLPG